MAVLVKSRCFYPRWVFLLDSFAWFLKGSEDFFVDIFVKIVNVFVYIIIDKNNDFYIIDKGGMYGTCLNFYKNYSI